MKIKILIFKLKFISKNIKKLIIFSNINKVKFFLNVKYK